MTTLPDKLSDLLELALGDLEKVEAMPEVYEVDMSDWHLPQRDEFGGRCGRCTVCLAGAVIELPGEEPWN